MAADDQSEISFSTPQGTLPWQPIFAVMHGGRWPQAASSAAGRANVGLCSAYGIIIMTIIKTRSVHETGERACIMDSRLCCAFRRYRRTVVVAVTVNCVA